jgi:hypothetical protein
MVYVCNSQEMTELAASVMYEQGYLNVLHADRIVIIDACCQVVGKLARNLSE